MTKPIETTFETLTLDVVKQLVARTEKKTGHAVKEVWFDMSQVSAVISMINSSQPEIHPEGDRELILLGYLGYLHWGSKEKELVPLRLAMETTEGLVWCEDKAGTVLAVLNQTKQEITNDKAN